MNSGPQPPWRDLHRIIESTETIRRYGRVSQVIGLVIEGTGPAAAVGEMCLIDAAGKRPAVPAEVVGFRENKILLMPLAEMRGVEPGRRIASLGVPAMARVGKNLLGRVVDAMGLRLTEKGRWTRRPRPPSMPGPRTPCQERESHNPSMWG